MMAKICLNVILKWVCLPMNPKKSIMRPTRTINVLIRGPMIWSISTGVWAHSLLTGRTWIHDNLLSIHINKFFMWKQDRLLGIERLYREVSMLSVWLHYMITGRHTDIKSILRTKLILGVEDWCSPYHSLWSIDTSWFFFHSLVP